LSGESNRNGGSPIWLFMILSHHPIGYFILYFINELQHVSPFNIRHTKL